LILSDFLAIFGFKRVNCNKIDADRPRPSDLFIFFVFKCETSYHKVGLITDTCLCANCCY